MSHTPGPWSATLTPYRLAGPVGPMFQVEAYPQSSYWVAYVQDTPEGRDNARLIAAAPEMLEALRNVRRQLESPYPFFTKGDQALIDVVFVGIDAAISKATGGTR